MRVECQKTDVRQESRAGKAFVEPMGFEPLFCNDGHLIELGELSRQKGLARREQVSVVCVLRQVVDDREKCLFLGIFGDRLGIGRV